MSKFVIIIGASAGVGRSLAAVFASHGWNLILVARSDRDLKAISSDLEIRYNVVVKTSVYDIGSNDFDSLKFFNEIVSQYQNKIEALLLPIGITSFLDQGWEKECPIDQLINTNLSGVVKVLSLFGEYFVKNNKGFIATFSSIAISRGRDKNAIYGAAKAGLHFYCEALRHRLASTSVIIQTYQLGYVDSALSFGQKLLFPIASPLAVAEKVYSGLGKESGVIVYPSFWRLVMIILNLVPWMLFKKLKF